MPDRYLPVLFWILALAACGRSADPALQIYANSKGAVIVTGMLGDERSRHDLTLAIGQALAGNGKGGEVHITVDNTVRLVEWPRKLQDAMPALAGIAELGLTVQDKTVTLAGALTAEERRAMPAALQAVFGPGYVITLEPSKTAAEPAAAGVAAAEPADKTIDPASLVHTWSVDVASSATRKARTASDPRAGFTLSYTRGDKPQPLDNDQVGKYEFDGGVVCTLSAAEDRERRFERNRALLRLSRRIDRRRAVAGRQGTQRRGLLACGGPPDFFQRTPHAQVRRAARQDPGCHAAHRMPARACPHPERRKNRPA